MLATSAKWVRTITDRLRLQGLLSVTLDVTSPGIYEGIRTSAPQLDSISNSDDVFDRHLAPFQKAFTLERDRTRADGTFLVPSTVREANEQIVPQFLPGLPVTFEIILSSIHDVPAVQVTWDEITQSYPTHFVVTGYDVTNGVIGVVDVVDNTEMLTSTPTLFEDCKRVEIQILEMYPSTWRARISQIGLGVLINFREGDRILRAGQHRAGSLISSRVPGDTADLELNNLDIYFDPLFYQGYAKHLSQRQQIEWQWGITTHEREKLWLLPQKYFLDGWEVPSDGVGFRLKCCSRLEFLMSFFRGDNWNGQPRTFWDLVNLIMRRSDVIRLPDEPDPWIMPETFKELVTTAPIPVAATKELLRDIADATGTVLDIDPLTAFIRFRPLAELSNVFDFATISSSTFDPASTFSNVFESTQPERVNHFTLERDRTKADGTFYVLGAEVPTQLITPQFFPGQPTVFEIDLNFGYNVPTIVIEWDTLTNSWATEFEIAGYTEEGVLVAAVLVEDNAEVTSTIDLFFLGAATLTVTVYKWSQATWRTRLTRMATIVRQLQRHHSKGAAPRIEIDDPMKYLRVNVRGYAPDTSQLKQAAQMQVTLNGAQEIIVPLTELYAPTSLVVATTTGVISNIVTTTGEVSFTITGAGVATVTISGYPIVSSIFANPGFEDPIIASGATITKNNWAVTSPELAEICQEHLLKVLLGRQRFTTDYIGFPELELYDYLEQTSKFGTVHTYVSELDLEFNGGYSGKVVSRIVEHAKD